MQERLDQPVGALPLVKEDEKQGVDDPMYRQVSRVQRHRIKQVKTKRSGCRDIYLRKRVHGVEEICSQISN
jgi:hypothetical protein